eukprot:CAMPEP_0113533296 /NCGR_PEP_ID=MMETSP0015_2-20120614/4522_1 /TAXON_ID=2838 /ORGANISM="Odontella" /LENGTH=233 /DNA_ID=CAMNT_0000432325 /DNA_START=195 /DNA_END=896 /DNA_ORIENTATION=- /assembly_acc=CAM_ASM_000160
MSIAAVFGVVFFAINNGAGAFTAPINQRPSSPLSPHAGFFGLNSRGAYSSTRHSYLAAGFLDDIGKFFDDMGKSMGNSDNSDSGDNVVSGQNIDEESEFYGSSRVLTIPVDSLKVGGLRLYLSLYLMGQQNTPDKGSWRANQVGDSGIDVYYQDRTGALMIDLSEDSKCITIDRLGSSPSMQYLMQESAILGGLLDELDTIASDEEINEPNRLIQLAAPGNAIESARETLSFS